MYQVILIFSSVGTCSDHKRETKGSFVNALYELVSEPEFRSNPC